jgi:hypothetical protein
MWTESYAGKSAVHLSQCLRLEDIQTRTYFIVEGSSGTAEATVGEAAGSIIAVHGRDLRVRSRVAKIPVLDDVHSTTVPVAILLERVSCTSLVARGIGQSGRSQDRSNDVLHGYRECNECLEYTKERIDLHCQRNDFRQLRTIVMSDYSEHTRLALNTDCEDRERNPSYLRGTSKAYILDTYELGEVGRWKMINLVRLR